MANKAVAVPLASLTSDTSSAGQDAAVASALTPGEELGSTPDIETNHVRQVYDRISEHWSRTRYKPWPRVLEFLAAVPKYGVLADVGCGNGKYLQPALDGGAGFVVGLDASLPLLELALQKMYEDKGYDRPWLRRGETGRNAGNKRDANGTAKSDASASSSAPMSAAQSAPRKKVATEAATTTDEEANNSATSTRAPASASSSPPAAPPSAPVSASATNGDAIADVSAEASPMCDAAGADIVRLAMRSESVDAVLCIAVLHHLSSEIRRKHAIREMARVLVKGGRMLVYAWAKEQEAGARAKFPSQDVFVPWEFRAHGKSYTKDSGGDYVVQRYCHVYVEGELEGLVAAAGGLVVETSYYDKGNWCVIARKQ
jgi:tRNA (uracil-5-)-methyltransferase TRM9